MKHLKLTIPIFLVLLLASCGGTETNDISYVTALGFDAAEDGYIITVQLAKPTQISGGASEDGGKGGADIVENIAVEAPDIYSGIDLANHIISKRFSLAHSKLIVFSKAVAESGIADILETLSRNEEIRPDIYLAVADGSAREYLYNVQPVVDVNPAKYYQLVYGAENNTGVVKSDVFTFVSEYKSGCRDSVLPLTGVTAQKEDSGGSGGGGASNESSDSGENPQENENEKHSDAEAADGAFEFRLKDYIAGETAVNGINKSEVMGMAVFRGDKLQYIAGSVETELYNILTGRLNLTYMTLKSDTDEPVTVRVMQEKRPETEIDTDNKTVKIRLFLEADYNSLPADYTAEAEIGGFEETAQDEISEACEKFLNKTVKENHADILGFREKLKPRFLTNADFYAYDADFSEYSFSVEPRLIIRRTGLIVREVTGK